MIKRDTAGVILFDDSNRVLLQKKTSDFQPAPNAWLFFGGGIERGEEPLKAARREILEELGIEINPSFFMKTRYENMRSGRYGHDYTHVARFNIPLRELRLTEGAGMGLFEQYEILPLNMLKYQKRILRRFYTKWLKI